jgi:cation diffusion facilitator family transporter
MSVEVASLSREKEIYKVTIVGSIVNFVLLAFKFVAGILGHSAAMLADAVHSLSDFVTDVIVLVFVRISNKPQDKDHDYGHGKYETLATAIIGILLLLVGFGILWNGAFSIWAFMKENNWRHLEWWH